MPLAKSTSLFNLTHNLDCTLLDAVLGDDFAVMQHIELLSGILACVQHDGFFSTWMVRKEISHVQNVVSNDHPAILVCLVLGNLIKRNGHIWICAWGEDIG